MAGEFAGKASFVEVDVDENEDLVDKFGVGPIPTIVILKDGKEHDRVIGADAAAIRKAVQSAL